MHSIKGYLKKWGICCICLLVALTVAGCQKEFDAAAYTKAMLDLSFQGDTQQALEIIKGTTQESLKAQYEEFVAAFVAGNITNEMELDELKTAEFSDLVSDIFAVMRYDVGEARKTGEKEYKVPVTVQPSDIFVQFQERIVVDSLKIAEKVRSGGYQGTETEIADQVMRDIENHSYELLDASYRDGKYEEAVTVDVMVKADKENEYAIDGEDMENLVVKILQLDVISH